MARKTKTTSVRDASADGVQPHGTITSWSLVTQEMIEQRAREIALISGREPNRVTSSDRIQAKKELLGDASANAPADEPDIVPGGMGVPPTSTGQRTKRHLPTDDEVEIQTVQEGVDEAEHNSMLQASKTQTRSEG